MTEFHRESLVALPKEAKEAGAVREAARRPSGEARISNPTLFISPVAKESAEISNVATSDDSCVPLESESKNSRAVPVSVNNVLVLANERGTGQATSPAQSGPPAEKGEDSDSRHPPAQMVST